MKDANKQQSIQDNNQESKQDKKTPLWLELLNRLAMLFDFVTAYVVPFLIVCLICFVWYAIDFWWDCKVREYQVKNGIEAYYNEQQMRDQREQEEYEYYESVESYK